jgi:hypothetical protein
MARFCPPVLAAIVILVAWPRSGQPQGPSCPCQPETPDHAVGRAPAHDDPHGEHASALAIFQAADVTHRARKSGDWSDPSTWDHGIPTDHARVVIPRGVTVALTRQLEPALDWLRLEGTLRFGTDADTRLRVATILIPGTGCLRIGSEHERLRADKTAQILFVPRSPAHRQHDPFDISGGIIALGQVQLYGSEYRGFAMPLRPAEKGTSRLTFAEAPRGWKAGDELLFPASTADAKDERRTVARLAADGKTVTLSAPLETDHAAPAGVPGGVPVGNLTRNIVLASVDPDTLANRAHLMFMSHEGIHLSGALFRGLGRTLATRIHSLPEKDGHGHVTTGDNLIGRYAVHYHLRCGASLARGPQYFTGNVIIDSPKHGLVNHGGYVIAENNVTYAVHGSHFFAENGSEVGAFRNNLAVYSRGSGDAIRSRDCRYDFGHGGHGFWTQSPAVVMEGNYAFHHADAAYSIFARPVVEFGRVVLFDRRNLARDVQPSAASDQVAPGSIPFHFERNAGGNSAKGLEVWNVNTYATHNVPSVIADCRFWDTPRGGIDLPYTFHTHMLRTVLFGRPDDRYPAAGIGINGATKFVSIEGVSVTGFAVGVEMPVRGYTTIADSRFNNATNIRITSPVQPGRRMVLTGNSFTHRSAQDIDYNLAGPDCRYNGDLSLLFARDLLLVEDARFPGETLYWAEQHPDAVPLPKSEVAQLRGKTARLLWDEYGLAVAGSLAPAESASRPRVRGLVGPVNGETRRGIAETAANTFADDVRARAAAREGYTLDQNRDWVAFVKGKPGEPSGWRLETSRVGGHPRTRLLYVDSTPPHFELNPHVKLEIHPDDVKYGLEICGILHDEVAGKPTIKNMIKEYRDLKVDPDGYVTVKFCCADSVGNAAEHRYRFLVTDAAVKRGSNLGYYNQKEYQLSEASAAAAVPQPAQTGRWWWAGGATTLLALGLVLHRRRRQRQRRRPAA